MVDGEGQGKLSDPLVDLTPQELTAFLHADAHMMPRSKKDLQSWAKSYFGWQLAGVPICPDHQAPLDILWELFQEEILDVVILASRTGGKCCIGTDKVARADGSWVEIQRIDRPIEIQSMDEHGKWCWVTAGPSEFNGFEPCLEIAVHNGMTHTITLDHPLMTRDGWKKAKDLNVGDEILCLGRNQRTQATWDDVPRDEAAWIGLMVGDGHCEMPITFSSVDRYLMHQMKRLCARLGFVLKRRNGRRCDAEICMDEGAGKRPAGRLLHKYGLYGVKSHGKRVPDQIMRSETRVVRAFLAHYFATDGTFEKTKNVCEFYSVSRRLLEDVRHLLLRLGISSRLAVKNGRYNGQRHKSWRLTLQKEDSRRFAGMIGREVPGAKGRALRGYRAKLSDWERKNDFQWDRIDAITDVGVKATWNLPVPKTHVYIANDVVSHNTVGLALLNVCDALFKSRVEIASMGAVLQQATKGYRYFSDMLVNHELFAADVKDTSMRETQLTNGSIVQVLTGTITGVNCLGGDTVVDALDGKHTLKELDGKSGFWVHGYDVEKKRWTVGEVERCWKAGCGPSVVITHGGGVVYASHDHPFLLRTGEWCRAESLKPGMPLMSYANDRVASVEPGPVMDLYDMTVNGVHTFVACGTVVSNSPHPHKARADEVELIEWEVLQQFFSMARSERGIQGQNVLSSTRKGLWGSMQRLLDKMENEPQFPFVLRTWCVKEVLEKCTEPCWKCREIVRAEDDRTFWDVCHGEARNSDGFYSVRDLHRKFLILDANVFDAEWECKKPSKQGLIYRELKDEQVGAYPFDPTKETFIGVDDGFVDPFVFLVLQKDGYGNIWAVRELFGSGKEHSTWIDEIKSLFYELGLNMKKTVIYVDVRATALIAELRKAGFQVRARSYGVVDSIRHVKKWVKGVHHPKLFIDGEFCPNLKREMGIYRYKPGSEQPMDKDNHACDALRYGICGKFPMRNSESGGGVPASAGDGGRLARETDPYNLEPEFTTRGRRKVDGW